MYVVWLYIQLMCVYVYVCDYKVHTCIMLCISVSDTLYYVYSTCVTRYMYSIYSTCVYVCLTLCIVHVWLYTCMYSTCAYFVTKVPKYCVESTGCTKWILIDNDKSNISNEISTWWLVCYLEQDLKPSRIQAIFLSFFLACRTCVLSLQSVCRSCLHYFIPEICALVLFIAISSLLNDKSASD